MRPTLTAAATTALLLGTTAALERPAPAARAALVFEDFDLVARAPQLKGRDHARKASAEHEDLLALGGAFEGRWAVIGRGQAMAHRGHCAHHGTGAAGDTDQLKQVAAGHLKPGVVLHGWSPFAGVSGFASGPARTVSL